MQHIQELDEKRQIGCRTALDQCQHELTAFQADEVVGVLGPFGNTAKVAQAAKAVVCQESFKRRAVERGKDGHGVKLSSKRHGRERPASRKTAGSLPPAAA